MKIHHRRPQGPLSLLRFRLLPGLLVLACTACAPIYSDFQSARVLDPGQAEVTPSFNVVTYNISGDGEHWQNNIGVEGAYGAFDRFEFRLGYARVFVSDEDTGVNVIGGGPKFSLVHDKIAVYVPFGFAFGEDFSTGETWRVHPTVLLTYELTDTIEFNPSGKVLFSLGQEDNNMLVAFNMGMGIAPNLEEPRWVLRPEVGVLVDPDEDGIFWNLGLGVTFRLTPTD